MATGIGFHIKQDCFLYPLFLMGLIIQLHICEKKTKPKQNKAKNQQQNSFHNLAYFQNQVNVFCGVPVTVQ